MKESKTTYAYVIEHMQNPSFQKVWDIAYDFVHKLPSNLCDELHESLNRGVDVLDSEPLLQMYIYSFGKMHYAKLLHAFNHLQDRVKKENQIEIVDYGCGQGLASLCYHDFIKEQNLQQKVTRIILIEPSSLALSRSELLCSCFYPDAEIVAVNKHFDDLSAEDIKISSGVLTLHLFSNILDVESYNLHHLIQTVTNLPSQKNEYVIVSPIQNTLRTQRLNTFATMLDGFIYYEEYLDKRQLDKERDWTCAVLLCSSITKQELADSECEKVFKEACSFYEQRDKYFDKEKGQNLFNRLLSCAEYGDKRCQNLLGIWYKDSIGTEQDSRLAFNWFKKATEQDFAPAYGNIGDLYYKGLGVELDYQQAVQYYKEGSDRNHSACQYRLGKCYLKGTGVIADNNKAFSLFKESSLQGYPHATFMLYKCYLNAWGTEKDEKTAIKYLKEASKLKHAQSCFILGKYYEVGKIVEKNEKKSLRLYIDSAKLGYAPAQEKLGDVYRQGLLGSDASPKKSFNWYLKAAEQGKSSAQFYVGYYYASGYGVKKDLKQAFEWYTKAAKQKNSAALNNLAICYEYGKGTELDLTKAVSYFEESAKLGNITAQKNLANCYRNGTGVISDPCKVFYWTLEAARKGDIDSQEKIALYYLKGYGTTTNQTEALLWYTRHYSETMRIDNADEAFDFLKRKADEEDPQALYIVGKCLQYGVAIEQNIRNAYTYFQRAAELGHIESLIKIHRISSLYELCSIKEDKKIHKDAYGVIYSEDKNVLIDGGYLKGNSYQIARGTRIICDNALDSGDVEKIIIPSSVVVIGNNPFAKPGWGRCSVKNIECYSDKFVVSDCALYTKDKKKLISYFGKASNVTIPEGVEIIGCEAFAENEDLNEIKFPESLSTIENAAFKYCLNLRKISLPESVTTIGEQCFYGCESLEETLSLGSVDIIRKEAFCGCNIQKLLLPSSLIEIDDNAFNSNSNLYSISLPKNVRRIGNSCFAYCSIKKIDFNTKLQEIGDFCFFDCPINNIIIPTSVQFLGLNPFIGTKTIECENNYRFVAESGLLYDKQSGDLISYYGETEVALYPPITHVNSFAFYNSKVTDIFVGSNIVKVSAWAFYNARKLEKVIWRNSKITVIPHGCFGNCSKISKIDIPSCVEFIQEGAFFDCTDLRTIKLYGFVTKANEDIFCRVETTKTTEDIFSKIEEPTRFPSEYWHRHELIGSSILDSDLIEQVVDPQTFPIIEVIVPVGCSENYSFTPIYDKYTYNSRYGMNRRFIVIENDEK